MNIEENLKNHQIELEDASTPAGNYVPYIITNKLVFISGQLPFKQGKIPITGVVGETVSSEDAIEMAKLCALALISQLKSACDGDLNKVSRVINKKTKALLPVHIYGQPSKIDEIIDFAKRKKLKVVENRKSIIFLTILTFFFMF